MVQAAVTDIDTYVSGTSKTLTNKTLTAPKIADGGFIADANGNELVVFQTTGSAVNELDIANAATGGAVTLSTTGGDSNIDLTLTPKGTGEINIAASNLNYAGTAVTATGAELNILDASAATAVASDVASSSGALTSNNYSISHTLTLAATLADDAVHADVTITSNKVLATSVIIANASIGAEVDIHTVVAGSFKVSVKNVSGSTLADDSTIIINYRVI
jgi:hypothetical protein